MTTDLLSARLSLMLGFIFIVSAAYAAGRLQQWSRSVRDREDAFRDGYNLATVELFGMASHVAGRTATPKGEDVNATQVMSLRSARHSIEDRVSKTVRLTPEMRQHLLPKP